MNLALSSLLLWMVAIEVKTQSTEMVQTEEAVFIKEREYYGVGAKWNLALIIDMKPYRTIAASIPIQLGFLKKNFDATISWYQTRSNFSYADIMEKLRAEVITLQSASKRNLAEINMFMRNRERRAVLPVIGSIMNLLFGTAVEEDTADIKKRLEIMAFKQQTMTHVMEESLSKFNVTRVEVQRNRDHINNAIWLIETVSQYVRNMSDRINEGLQDLEEFNIRYMTFNMATERIREMHEEINSSFLKLITSYHRASMGSLDQYTITPDDLYQTLIEIQKKLPENLKLPINENTDLLEYYKWLKPVTQIRDQKIVLVIDIPLVNVADEFEIFRAKAIMRPYVMEK